MDSANMLKTYIKKERWERDKVVPGHTDNIIKDLNPDSGSNDDTKYESNDIQVS